MSNFREDIVAGEPDHPALHNDAHKALNYVTYSSRYGNFADAIDAALLGAGQLRIPAGTHNANPLTIDGGLVIEGAGQGKTILKCTADEPLFTGDMASHVTLRNLTLDVNGGPALAGDWNACRFEDVTFIQRDSDTPIIDHNSTEGGAFQENIFFNCWLYATEGHTVPAVRLIGTNTTNLNQWIGGRCTYSGDYFFHIESVSAQSFSSNNSFRGVNFEITNGGNIRLLSCLNTLIEGCGTYDTHAIGDIANSLYFLGKSTDGGKSQRTTFLNTVRHGGTLADGAYDIYLDQCVQTTLLNNGSTSSNYRTFVNAAAVTGMFVINDQEVGAGKIGMTSPDGTLWAVGVSDAGALEVVEV